MHPIKKTLTCLLLVSLLTVSCSCGKQAEQTVTDTGKYLSDEAVSKQSGSDKNTYKYDTVKKDDFYNKVESNASFYVQDSKAARAEYKYGKMIFEKFLLSANTYVKAGDAIANVHIDVSNADIEEVKLSILRMQERLETDKKDYADEDARLKAKAYGIEGSQAQGVAIHEYEEAVALHKQELQNRQTLITNKQEDLEKMQTAAAITTINAPIDGYVTDLAVLKVGDEIKDKKILAVVEPTQSNIITVNNSQNDFHYGKQVDVLITTKEGKVELTGSVITPSKISVAGQANTTDAQVRLDKEIEELPAKEDIVKILVTVKANEIKNALMLKRGSLTEEKYNTYATVVKEDGSFQKQSVIIGGTNKEYYWILRGLEEGDTVVIP